MARVLAVTAVTAAVVFCIVQDRVTAAGARHYVDRQRAALTGQHPAVTIDEIMRPAIRRSVELGVFWSGSVTAVGLAGVALPAWRRRRE